MTLPGYEDIEGITPAVTHSVPLFLFHLKRHPMSDPVTSVRIEKGLNLTGPEVRAMVAACVRQGEPIASGPKGYWWAGSPEEIEITKRHLLARTIALQSRLRDYSKIQEKMLRERQLTFQAFGNQP